MALNNLKLLICHKIKPTDYFFLSPLYFLVFVLFITFCDYSFSSFLFSSSFFPSFLSFFLTYLLPLIHHILPSFHRLVSCLSHSSSFSSSPPISPFIVASSSLPLLSATIFPFVPLIIFSFPYASCCNPQYSSPAVQVFFSPFVIYYFSMHNFFLLFFPRVQ